MKHNKIAMNGRVDMYFPRHTAQNFPSYMQFFAYDQIKILYTITEAVLPRMTRILESRVLS